MRTRSEHVRLNDDESGMVEKLISLGYGENVSQVLRKALREAYKRNEKEKNINHNSALEVQ